MKLHILSDLHNEFWLAQGLEIQPIQNTDADIVILAGDIDTGKRGVEWAIEQAQHLCKPIIYVFGNHEYYGHTIGLLDDCRRLTENTGVRILEQDNLIYNGVRFLGATYWSDFLADPSTPQRLAMHMASHSVGDYLAIRKADGGRLQPDDTLLMHKASKKWLSRELAAKVAEPTVVITHHSPTKLGDNPRFPTNPLSGVFVSATDKLVAKADLWIYGHTHHSQEFSLKGTRIISNQRGYPREESGGFNPTLVVEV